MGTKKIESHILLQLSDLDWLLCPRAKALLSSLGDLRAILSLSKEDYGEKPRSFGRKAKHWIEEDFVPELDIWGLHMHMTEEEVNNYFNPSIHFLINNIIDN
ncbi:hypothetical protein D9V86_09990 [Bacteroidetes/Chlorobi group bacterium ChocPot_Mid]|nr:MAG: hypothetical protein D9V86_09990 [Bacteroidetes/Chlorobi group bacterium ChocPot_Mid]